MGGSFNPVHNAHLAAAEAAHDELRLDVVYFVPAAHPPHKDDRDLAPGDDRVAMVKLATKSFPWAMVSEMEFQRPGPSYTIDTVAVFDTLFRDTAIYLIIGSDTVSELKTWREIAELVKLVEFAVVDRGGRRIERDLAAAPPGVRLHRVRPKAASAVSATEIRRTRNMEHVPPEVADYIREHQLYV